MDQAHTPGSPQLRLHEDQGATFDLMAGGAGGAPTPFDHFQQELFYMVNGRKKVLILGHSFVSRWSTYVSGDMNPGDTLEGYMRLDQKAYSLVKGFPGLTVPTLLTTHANAIEDILMDYSPEIVILDIGINDLDSPHPRMSDLEVTETLLTAVNFFKSRGGVEGHGDKPLVGEPPCIYPHTHLSYPPEQESSTLEVENGHYKSCLKENTNTSRTRARKGGVTLLPGPGVSTG